MKEKLFKRLKGHSAYNTFEYQSYNPNYFWMDVEMGMQWIDDEDKGK